MISTNSTANYLVEKKKLEENISWYSRTILEIDKQQETRKDMLKYYKDQLFNLEKDYYK